MPFEQRDIVKTVEVPVKEPWIYLNCSCDTDGPCKARLDIEPDGDKLTIRITDADGRPASIEVSYFQLQSLGYDIRKFLDAMTHNYEQARKAAEAGQG